MELILSTDEARLLEDILEERYLMQMELSQTIARSEGANVQLC